MIGTWFQRVAGNRAQNCGTEVGAWPQRMEAAWHLFRERVPEDVPTRDVADLGCGRQELRALLPAGWSYTPYDWTSRSADTRVMDFSKELPQAQHEVIFILGVLEYLPEPARLLRHALTHSRWTVFSCFHGWNPLRAWREGWRGRLTRAQVEALIVESGARSCAHRSWRADGSLWVCEQANGQGGDA